MGSKGVFNENVQELGVHLLRFGKRSFEFLSLLVLIQIQ